MTLEQESQDQVKGVMMVEEMKLSLLGNTSTQGIRGTISGPRIRMNFTGNLQASDWFFN